MPYRDDDDARTAQIEALGARVAELEAENARLLVGERPVETLFGVPLTIVSTEERKGVVPRKASRTFFEGVDRALGEIGTHTVARDLLVWRSTARDLDVTVRSDGDTTTLRVSERVALVTGAMVGGVLGGGGGVTVLFFLLWLLRGDLEPLMLLAIPVWLLIMYGVARLLLARHVSSRKRKVALYATDVLARLPIQIGQGDPDARARFVKPPSA